MTEYIEFPLTKGFITKIDREDLEGISKFKWQSQRTSKNFVYAGASIKQEDGNWKRISLHRFILNVPKNSVIDHINGDQLDNRKANLRICGQSLNRLNSIGSGKSKYKGVQLRDRLTPWRASIKLSNGKYKHLGSYKTEIEAALAYNKAAKIEYGNRVLLNEIR